MRIDPDSVRRMAELAALRLDDAEVEAMSTELTRILDHMEVLSRFEPSPDRDGDSGEDTGTLRPDSGPADPLHRTPGEMAPVWEAPYFVVPRLPGVGDREG